MKGLYLTEEDYLNKDGNLSCSCEEAISEEELDKWGGLDIREVHLFIWENLPSLTYDERLVLSPVLDGLSLKEIAHLIDRKLSEVKAIKRKALKKLRKLYFSKYSCGGVKEVG